MINKKEKFVWISEICGWVCSLLPIHKQSMAELMSRYTDYAQNTIYHKTLQHLQPIENIEVYNNYKKNKGTLWRNNKKYTQYEEDVIDILNWLVDLGVKETDIARFVAPYFGRSESSIYSRLRYNKLAS